MNLEIKWNRDVSFIGYSEFPEEKFAHDVIETQLLEMKCNRSPSTCNGSFTRSFCFNLAASVREQI